MYAKERIIKNVPAAAARALDGAIDVWTWTVLYADIKLIISCLVGGRGIEYAVEFMNDIAARLTSRVQLTTDGHRLYLEAVASAFGLDIDYSMLRKLYCASSECLAIHDFKIFGDPDTGHTSTSYAERQNLTMRMCMRRFTRRTNGFSKRLSRHVEMVSLYSPHYNFCRVHKSPGATTAVVAGLAPWPYSMNWIVGLMDARVPKPRCPKAYKKRRESACR